MFPMKSMDNHIENCFNKYWVDRATDPDGTVKNFFEYALEGGCRVRLKLDSQKKNFVNDSITLWGV
jgi:hypothetical protein